MLSIIVHVCSSARASMTHGCVRFRRCNLTSSNRCLALSGTCHGDADVVHLAGLADDLSVLFSGKSWENVYIVVGQRNGATCAGVIDDIPNLKDIDGNFLRHRNRHWGGLREESKWTEHGG